MYHKLLQGKDLHPPSQEIVENNTGSTIPALKVVTYSELGTTFPEITPANGLVDRIRGIVQDDIPSGEIGYITAMGQLINVNTSAWGPGTELYADSAGNLTTVPNGPVVATVLKQHASEGILYVEKTAGATAGTGDVIGLPPSNNNAIVRYSGTSGKIIKNSPGTFVQDGGGLEAQGYMTRRLVTDLITVKTGQSWISPNIAIDPGGSIVIESGGEIIIV